MAIELIEDQRKAAARIAQLRFDTAFQVLGHIAAIDYATSIAHAREQTNEFEREGGLMVPVNMPLAAKLAVGYADCLLVEMGIIGGK